MNVSASKLSGNFSSSNIIYDLIQNNEMDIFRLSRKFVNLLKCWIESQVLIYILYLPVHVNSFSKQWPSF